jgi:predicted RNA polymerase sigma factor
VIEAIMDRVQAAHRRLARLVHDVRFAEELRAGRAARHAVEQWPRDAAAQPGAWLMTAAQVGYRRDPPRRAAGAAGTPTWPASPTTPWAA